MAGKRHLWLIVRGTSFEPGVTVRLQYRSGLVQLIKRVERDSSGEHLRIEVSDWPDPQVTMTVINPTEPGEPERSFSVAFNLDNV
jgi:hypothetical protein